MPTASGADSPGENLHTKWSLRPSVALRACLLLHSRQNRCFLVRFVKGWQPPWLGRTTDDSGQKWCCTVWSPAPTCTRSRWQASSNSPFPKLKGKLPFSFCKSGIVVVLQRSIGARLIKRHKQCWHFTARASEDHYVFSMSVSHYCVCDTHTLTGVEFI